MTHPNPQPKDASATPEAGGPADGGNQTSESAKPFVFETRSDDHPEDRYVTQDDDGYDPDNEYDAERHVCHWCDGEKYVEGHMFNDSLNYDPDEFYTCPCCGGSGKAEDCTFW